MKNGHEPKEGREKNTKKQTWLCQGETEQTQKNKIANITKHNKAYMTFVFHHSHSTFHVIRHPVILHTQLQRVQTEVVQS